METMLKVANGYLLSGFAERVDSGGTLDMSVQTIISEAIEDTRTRLQLRLSPVQADVEALLTPEDVVNRIGTGWHLRWLRHESGRAVLGNYTFGDNGQIETSSISASLKPKHCEQVYLALTARSLFNNLPELPEETGLQKQGFPQKWNEQIGIYDAHASDWLKLLSVYELFKNNSTHQADIKEYLSGAYIVQSLKRIRGKESTIFADIANARLAASFAAAYGKSVDESIELLLLKNTTETKESIEKRSEQIKNKEWGAVLTTKARLLNRIIQSAFITSLSINGKAEAFQKRENTLGALATLVVASLYQLPVDSADVFGNLQRVHSLSLSEKTQIINSVFPETQKK